MPSPHSSSWDTLLFDLDGTLTDSFLGIARSAQYALSQLGIDEPELAAFRRFIGPPLYDSFTEYYHLSPAEARRAVSLYRERYRDTGIFENRLYDGIPELLQALRQAGFSLCLATSKPEVFARRILAHFGIAEYFSFVAGSLLDGTRDDKAEVIRYVLEQRSIAEPAAALMIGDRKHDAIGAQENGVPFCGVLYGFGSEEELAAYPHVCLAQTPAGVGEFLLHG